MFNKIMEIQNAKIKDVFIGIEDHGVLTVEINCEGDGWGQSYGNYDMRRDLSDNIMRLLKTFEVESVQKLKGLPIRVERDNDRMICGVGHYTKESWFRFIVKV